MNSRNAPYLVLALSLLWVGIGNAAETEARIYKCTNPSGIVLYTDRVCEGGTAVDIRLDPADPAAPARLAHARAELDAAAARRRADEQMAAARAEEFNQLRLEAEAQQEATAPTADYPILGYGAEHRPSKSHPHHRGSPSEQHGHTRQGEGGIPAAIRSR